MAMVAKRMSLKAVEMSPGYDVWIRSIKERVQQARFKALMMANAEQILLYWDVGHEILAKQDAEGWGGVRLSSACQKISSRHSQI